MKINRKSVLYAAIGMLFGTVSSTAFSAEIVDIDKLLVGHTNSPEVVFKANKQAVEFCKGLLARTELQNYRDVNGYIPMMDSMFIDPEQTKDYLYGCIGKMQDAYILKITRGK